MRFHRKDKKPITDKGWLDDLLAIAAVYLVGTASVLAVFIVA